MSYQLDLRPSSSFSSINIDAILDEHDAFMGNKLLKLLENFNRLSLGVK